MSQFDIKILWFPTLHPIWPLLSGSVLPTLYHGLENGNWKLFIFSYLSCFHYGMNFEMDHVIQSNLFVSIQNLECFCDCSSINNTSWKSHVRSCKEILQIQIKLLVGIFFTKSVAYLPSFLGRLTSILTGTLGVALTELLTW